MKKKIAQISAVILLISVCVIAGYIKHSIDYGHPVGVWFPQKAEILLGEDYKDYIGDVPFSGIKQDKDYYFQQVYVKTIGSTRTETFDINGHELIVLGNRDLYEIDGYVYQIIKK